MYPSQLLLLIFGLIGPPALSMEVAAFRGVHQPPKSNLEIDNHTCTAQHIEDVEHDLLENTIEGIGASFEMGATYGHFNIQRTKDGRIVVFHDWTVNCRTNGKGQTNKLTFEYLRSLDIGYGYTKLDADGKPYYPFRGYPHPMPTVAEILREFPTREFLIFAKDSTTETAKALALELREFLPEDQSRIHFIGEQIDDLRRFAPHVSIFNSTKLIKQCSKWYLALGWLGYIHPSCRNTNIALPIDKFKKYFMWRDVSFVRDMQKAGSKIWFIQVDSEEDWKYASKLKPDGIGTYRMDLIAPYIDNHSHF